MFPSKRLRVVMQRGIGLYSPELFANLPPVKSKLAPLLREAMAAQRVSGEKHSGFWMDIGTPERLDDLDSYYRLEQLP